MRLSTYYRNNDVGSELSVIPNLLASVIIISIAVVIAMKYGALTIHHVKSISAFDILPYKEDFAVRLATTGERKIEAVGEGSNLYDAVVTHTVNSLEYRFTENPIIETISWRVEESASNTYLFLSWKCDVLYAKKQNDWLTKTYNGSALLCK